MNSTQPVIYFHTLSPCHIRSFTSPFLPSLPLPSPPFSLLYLPSHFPPLPPFSFLLPSPPLFPSLPSQPLLSYLIPSHPLPFLIVQVS